jgi:hypothetical protein
MPAIESIIGLSSIRSDLQFKDPEAAVVLDDADGLKSFRNEFELPTNVGIGAMLDSPVERKCSHSDLLFHGS